MKVTFHPPTDANRINQLHLLIQKKAIDDYKESQKPASKAQ